MSNQDHVFIKIDLVKRKPDSLAVIRTDRKGQPVESFSDAVSITEDFPCLIRRMTDQVLAPKYSKEYVVVAYYCEIERPALQRELAPSPVEVFEGRTWLSCSQLIWPMVEAQMVPSTAFDTVCAYFEVDRSQGGELQAERDCTALARIFFELMRRYKSALLVEEGVRDIGGPWFERARKVIGI